MLLLFFISTKIFSLCYAKEKFFLLDMSEPQLCEEDAPKNYFIPDNCIRSTGPGCAKFSFKRNIFVTRITLGFEQKADLKIISVFDEKNVKMVCESGQCSKKSKALEIIWDKTGIFCDITVYYDSYLNKENKKPQTKNHLTWLVPVLAIVVAVIIFLSLRRCFVCILTQHVKTTEIKFEKDEIDKLNDIVSDDAPTDGKNNAMINERLNEIEADVASIESKKNTPLQKDDKSGADGKRDRKKSGNEENEQDKHKKGKKVFKGGKKKKGK